MSSNLFDFFDRIYCINLPDSTERWTNVSHVFDRLGILDRVERVWATPPTKDFNMSNFNYPPGEFGVCMSQTKALGKAMSEGAKNFLLFEDDVDVVPGGLERLESAITELPADWDIFYLGGNPRERLVKVSSNVSRTGFFYGGFAYAINSKSFFEIFSRQLDGRSRPFPESTYDYILAEYAASHNGYCVDPYTFKNIPGHSVIRNAHRNYDKVFADLWKDFGSDGNSNASLTDALKR